MANWSDSGLSQAEYCRQKKLAVHQFYYHSRKLFEKSQQSNQPVEFEALQITDKQPESGFKLNLYARFLKLDLRVDW